MAEKKITEVQALTIARALVEDYVTDGAEFENAEFTPAEVAEKLDKMIEVRGRKRERKSDDSKKLANIALGKKFAEAWTGGEFKCADVRDFLEVSSSKANAVIRAMGWEQVESTEKVKVYKL